MWTARRGGRRRARGGRGARRRRASRVSQTRADVSQGAAPDRVRRRAAANRPRKDRPGRASNNAGGETVMADSFRVEELAKRAKLSVDTVRYYQHRGLLPPPERNGRVAYYSPAHLARLSRIKELKQQGLSLQTIKRVLEGIHPADAALVAAVAGKE